MMPEHTENDFLECPIGRGARDFPDRTAVVAGDLRIGYRALEQMVSGVAERLGPVGRAGGTIVAVAGSNSVEYVAAVFGILRAGLTACLLNTRVPVITRNSQLAAIGCNLLLTDADRAADLATDSSTVSASASADSGLHVRALADVAHGTPGSADDVATLQLAAHATIVFTSGSTGAPKAVVHTLANHYYSSLGSESVVPLRETDVWLASLPFFHVGGLAILFRSFLAGASVEIAEPRDAPERISRQGITHASLVQAQLKRWVDLGGRVGSDLRVVLAGGSSIAPGLFRGCTQRGLPIRLTYGSTEMASQIATRLSSDPDVGSGYCGPVLPYREVRIGDSGRIEVRGETRFAGYLTPEGLTSPFDADGWFRTSDVGVLEADGLYVTGRLDNMFISGGENVHPELIERVISSVAGVREVVVVPVIDEEYGQVPVAIVDSSGEVDGDELKAAVSSVHPRYMVPARILSWPGGSERDDVSKTDRKAMRAYAEKWLQGENQ